MKAPSPFLEPGVEELRPGRIHLVLDTDGNFTWTDADGSIEGRYEASTTHLTMTSKEPAEIIPMTYALSAGRLVLRTPDGFEFVMQRAPTP